MGGGDWTAIPNFIDPTRFKFVAKVPNDAPLVFLSRIERIKGAHNAIAIARASGRRLLIAGNRVETPEGRRYWSEEIAPQLEHPLIKYVGPVDDFQKDRLLGGAAAMVVPIEWDEPFGIVFAEALACGTPIITSPRGSALEIVRPSETGFLIRTTQEGAEAVSRLSTICRRTCRNDAESRYSVGPVAKKYFALYMQLIARSKASIN